MSRLIWIAIALIALQCVASASDVAWVSDYPTALAKARSTKRLMMVYIYSDWCPYCRRLNESTYPDPVVVAKSRQVVPFKINADSKDNKRLISKFGLLGFPTILFIDGNEQIQGKIPGFEGPEAFAQDIDRFISSYRTAPQMKARIARDPNDSEANVWMAALMAWRNDVSSAERHLAVGKQGSYRGIWYSRALTAIGDIHQMGNRVDRAIALFQEAAKHARDRYDLGYAKISLMFCHSMRKDREAMLSAAREVLATRGMMEEYRKTAREVIAKAGGAPSP